MTVRPEFGLINSEFNSFLFAPIGEEESGIQLTALSGLTRLALDPWGEAARLAALPKDRAAVALATIIARLPLGRWELVDVPAIADRLVQLLPAGVPASLPARPAANTRVAANNGKKQIGLVSLGLAVLILGASVLGLWPARTTADRAPSTFVTERPAVHQEPMPR